MKVALVHDYLKEYGGAERVVEALHEIFPEAPVYTAYYDPKGLGPHADRLKDWDIKTSWLQKIPGAGRLISPFRLLSAKAFESFDLSEYDVVISSCNIYFSKAVKVKPGALHISYIHTPPRYLYGYATSFNYKKSWWKRIGAELANHYLRIVDFETSQKPDILVANSENVKERIGTRRWNCLRGRLAVLQGVPL
ncbi:MAG: Glycosyl transferase, group 1 [Candidatus Daviesbacteria bacterium GW2011_GWA1_42_6]|uniref:Glycosyl transferase, group 1 n=1 Tax=Candidatus Daviesbacteria bacterium GW2011_GWA1_42_6 TaxID=1618420 RepID=A0A0G1AVU8_9BACT|nr:MAG: Glycosyl transferase, group 1 [Candidatus Daviesbacteria bacterium GW2011_GWA1_42_6]